MRIAASFGCAGANPAAWSCAAFGALCQSSLLATVVWFAERIRVSFGLASALAMPKFASDGPVATIATVLLEVPLTTKPAIITSWPVNTCARVDRFMSRGGVKIAVTLFAVFSVTLQAPGPLHAPV